MVGTRATANTFLTGVSLQPHSGCRYSVRMRLAALILLVLGLSATVATGSSQGARRHAPDRGRARSRSDHRQGSARRPDGEGVARDHRPQPDRPVEPARERHPARQGGHAPRQERLLLRARRPLPARGTGYRHLDLGPRHGHGRPRRRPRCRRRHRDGTRSAIAASVPLPVEATKTSFGPGEASAPSSQSVKIQP